MSKRPLTDKNGEVRPLTAEDFKHFKPIREVDPGMIEAVERFKRRLSKAQRGKQTPF